MKKHIAGFILFCFIVGIAVFVSKSLGIFVLSDSMSHCDAIKAHPKQLIRETDATIGTIDAKSPRVTQAFFNLTTKQVNLELLFKKQLVFDNYDEVVIKFNYFRINGQGARFIRAETVRLMPESFSYEPRKTSASIVGSYEWLDNLDSYESIYVIAELTDRYSSDKALPKFDADFAKEIVLFSGKLNRMEIIGERNIEK